MLNEYYGRPELQHGFTGGLRKAGEAIEFGLGGPPPAPRDMKTSSDAPEAASDVKSFLESFKGAREGKPLKLKLQDLVIPEPSTKFKSSPGYNPTLLPLIIQKEIMNPGFMGAGGFGVSSTFTDPNVPRGFGRTSWN